MLYFIGYFHRVSVTVIVEDLMRDFSVSATSLGLFSSLYFYPYAAMQIPAGLLVDSLGPRKMLTCFSLLTSIGSFIFALAPTFPAAMVGRTILGVGVSVAFLCTAKLISSWFDVRSFASLTGVLVSIGNVGALVASAPLALMVTNLGWRFSFLLIAAATLVLTIALWLVVRDSPQEELWQSCLSPRSSTRFRQPLGSGSGVRLAFKSREFWLTASPPLFFFGTFISLQGLWGVPYLMQSYGLSRVDASLLVMMISVGFCVGATFWGLVSDRLVFSRRRVYIFGTALYCFVWALLALLSGGESTAYVLILFLSLGFSFGVMPVSIVIVKELFPKGVMGSVTGSANAFPFIGAALYQLWIGYFLDNFGLLGVIEGVRIFSRAAYQTSFAICLGSLLAAMVMVLLIREPREHATSPGSG
ncbi:MAG: MFS transporter [Candidatus Bathyarchaeia archaeon]